jgi:biopolymer transport protein ExbB
MNKKSLSIMMLQAVLVFGSPLLFAQDPAAPATNPIEAAQPAVDPAAPFDPNAPIDPNAPVDPNAAPVDPAAAFEAEPADQMSAVDSAAESTAVENPYGLGALWSQGDFIARGTLIIMVIMSAGTWYILFTKLWEQTRLSGQARAAAKVWDAGSMDDGARQLKENSAYRAIVEDGLNALHHHDGRLTDKIDLQEWVTLSVQRSVERINSQMQGGLTFLATVGSTAPFVGLFGTVWGIYHALVAIGVSGQASIDKVAGPVGEALIMTAIGLAVAVPAVLGYNWLVRRNKLAMEDMRYFAGDVHAYLVMGERVTGAGDTPAQPRPTRTATRA